METKINNKKSNASIKHRQWFLALYILPALILFSVFAAVPVILSMRISLYEWNGIGPKTFVGLGNFVKLLTVDPWNTRFFGAFRNTIVYFLLHLIIQNVPAFFLAYLLSQGLKGSRFFRGLFFLPTTLSLVMVGFLGKLFFNPLWGPFNKLMQAIGLHFLSLPWLGLTSTALPTIVVIGAWQSLGIPLVLFNAALLGIQTELLEAARMDGASELRILWHIILPLVAPVIGIVSILTFVGNFTGFEMVYATEGTLAGPSFATDTLGTLFYRTCFGEVGTVPQMGLGAAISIGMVVIVSAGLLVWLWYNRRVERWLGYSSKEGV
jgi:raffinose/stachyose/melibiose transport system permease protein